VRHLTILIVFASVVSLSGAELVHQSRDFSGTWTAVKDAPAGVAAAPSPVFGPRFSIRHAGDSLSLTRTIRETSVETTLSLDGREVKTKLPSLTCQGESFMVETAARDGDAIAVSTVGMISPGGNATKLSVKRMFRLEAPDTLVVEGTMTQAGQSRAVATVYKKSADPIPPAVSAGTGATPATATIADVAWIGGVWVGGANSVVEERWTPPSGGSMLAISRTMRNNAMTAFEFLCIVERNGGLVYTAMPNARMPPTDFTLTKVTPDSATFENPAHDFPKMIRYSRLPDGSLETLVAGADGARPVTVVLKKQ
jgi:Domain of unknown function (DUF6265)